MSTDSQYSYAVTVAVQAEPLACVSSSSFGSIGLQSISLRHLNDVFSKTDKQYELEETCKWSPDKGADFDECSETLLKSATKRVQSTGWRATDIYVSDRRFPMKNSVKEEITPIEKFYSIAKEGNVAVGFSNSCSSSSRPICS